jgi:hypothetical protein
MEFYKRVFSTEESNIFIRKYIDTFVTKNQIKGLIWENIDYEVKKKSFISFDDLLIFAEEIENAFFFTYYTEDYPDYIEGNRVKETESIQYLLEFFKDNPQDFYIFDETFQWTVISCHEYLDEKDTENYLLIRI